MTALLDRAMGVVLSLPSEDQDEIARAMLALAGDDEPAEDIAPEHLGAVLEGLRQVEEGCFATPAEIEAVLARSRA
jgi:hypothetical protein